MLFWWKETAHLITGEKESIGHENDVLPKPWYACVCVYIHISVCVLCVFPYAYTHTPFSKVIWYNLENKIFLTGLFLNTVCPLYALYCVCKEIYPYGNL